MALTTADANTGRISKSIANKDNDIKNKMAIRVWLNTGKKKKQTKARTPTKLKHQKNCHLSE